MHVISELFSDYPIFSAFKETIYLTLWRRCSRC